MCVRTGDAKDCQLLGAASLKFHAPAGTVAVPNAGGAGYYRFDLPAADWQTLITALPALPAGEALSVDDSLWASFRAGRAPAASLVAEARAILGNPDSNASLIAGERFAGLRLRGLIEGPALADYSRMMDGLYGPKLAALGLDPAVGAYASEDPDRQKLRQELVALVVSEARDPAAGAKLVAAAKAYLAGDAKALDQGYMGAAFAAHLKAGGLPAAKALLDKALSSEDAVFRSTALGAVGGSGLPEVGTWVLGLEDSRLRPLERLGLVGSMAATAETKDMAGAWILANYDRLAGGGNGIFVTARLTSALRYQCSVDRAVQIDKVLGPKVRAANKSVLDFERTLETIRHCGDLKAARESELATALKAAS